MPNSLNNIIKDALPNSQRSKNLLNGLYEGKITMAEFDKECAYWFITSEDLQPLTLPLRIEKMKLYDNMSENERDNVPATFWRQKEVFTYLEQYHSIKERNKGMLEKLLEFKSYIPKEDTTTIAKFDTLINEYIGLPEELKTAQDFFGGKIERKDIDE